MSQKYTKKKTARRRRSNKTPLFLSLAGILLLAAAAMFFFRSSNRQAGFIPEVSGRPNLKVDQEVVDLGAVPLGQLVSVSFKVSNTGDKPLKFTKKPYIEVVEGC